MNECQTELVAAARFRAKVRREIRKENDRIANQLDALCDEIERLQQKVDDLKDARLKMDIAHVDLAGALQETERLQEVIRAALSEYYLSDQPFCGNRMRDALEASGITIPGYEGGSKHG